MIQNFARGLFTGQLLVLFKQDFQDFFGEKKSYFSPKSEKWKKKILFLFFDKSGFSGKKILFIFFIFVLICFLNKNWPRAARKLFLCKKNPIEVFVPQKQDFFGRNRIFFIFLKKNPILSHLNSTRILINLLKFAKWLGAPHVRV